MSFKEVLECEGQLTQEIRDQVADFEERTQNYLDQLLDPGEEDEDEEDA